MGKSARKYYGRKQRVIYFGSLGPFWDMTYSRSTRNGAQYCKRNPVFSYSHREAHTKVRWLLLLIRFGFLSTTTISVFLSVRELINLQNHFSGKLRDISSITHFFNIFLAIGRGKAHIGRKCQLSFRGVNE